MYLQQYGELPSVLGTARTWSWLYLDEGCRKQALEGRAQSQGTVLSIPILGTWILHYSCWSKEVETISFMFLKHPVIWKEDAGVSLLIGNRILKCREAMGKVLGLTRKGS